MAIIDAFRTILYVLCMEGIMQFNIMAQFRRPCVFVQLIFARQGGAMPRYIWSIFRSISVFISESCLYFFMAGHFEIEFSKAVPLLFTTVKMDPISRSFSPSLSCKRLIFPPLSALSLSFVSLNKAANGAWKWWQQSHAYRQTLSLSWVAVCK